MFINGSKPTNHQAGSCHSSDFDLEMQTKLYTVKLKNNHKMTSKRLKSASCLLCSKLSSNAAQPLQPLHYRHTEGQSWFLL